MLQSNDTKFCQSCIERGINPPNTATREWQKDIYCCDECLNARIENMTMIHVGDASPEKEKILATDFKSGPMLDFIYNLYQIPPELQFDRIGKVEGNYDKIFNFHAPAIVNRSLESLTEEIEQLEMALFHIKYRREPLEMRIKVLKDQKRKEKGLESYNDSKEEYAKGPKKKSTVKTTQEEKLAKSLGMTLEQYQAMVGNAAELEKKKNQRKFNIMCDNCAECGGQVEVRVKENGQEIPYCKEHAPVVTK